MKILGKETSEKIAKMKVNNIYLKLGVMYQQKAFGMSTANVRKCVIIT